ncbi:DUF1254 domain-containing protein [Lysobacter sp. S4-A87]|uniref:DUF1254 domain-containing protein n=1 Tax=Lysobacter sp. S4-A87 TaxID=2925843 RepID=UPI001F530EA2|nr:DUF1254 domain-containing protein [Lysobacter sp. S4-A87]UNK51031.1 DUF1254 domain-containing protein [Lysobacter sp. S4-A87]
MTAPRHHIRPAISGVALAAMTALLLSACSKSDQATSPEAAAPASTSAQAPAAGQAGALTAAEAREIARDAYVYGVPLVDQYKTMHAYSIDKGGQQYQGPFNTVLNMARVFTPADTAFVTPNSDTPYTFAALDLRAEPAVITVPKMETGRYFVFQLMDLYTFNFDYIGSRTTGNDGGSFLIAGPKWQGAPPKGITKVIRSETDLVTVVGRTQMFNPADLANVKKIQAGYKVQPLSAFLGTPAPPAAPAVEWPNPIAPGKDTESPEFFNQLAFLLQFAQPPNPSETALMQRFARLGIEPGKPFDPGMLSPELQAAVKQGVADGQKQIDDRRASLGGKTDMLFGTREFLKNDYVARATGTQVGIGANSREEAMYPILDKDADGQPLDGSKGKYTLRFAPGQLPPVNAFWSVTMYDLPQQLLVKNPIDRYLINSPMLSGMKKDSDGGLTIHVQSQSPGKDKEANWLPAPNGPFVMFMRYYWPKQALLDDQWKTPAVTKAP